MAGISGWYSTAYECAEDPSKSHGVGWYLDGQLLASTYQNPTTGAPYTPQELSGLAGGGGEVTTEAMTAEQGVFWNPLHHSFWNVPENPAPSAQAAVAAAGGSTTPTTTPAIADTVSGVPALAPYKPSPEAAALAGEVGGAISGIIEEGGLGIGEEVKEDLFLREAEMINASNAQSIKNMEDEMARRGMSNSGQVFSETMKLNSKADVQMANVMRDVEIADAYMKLASYENAIGMGVQFLSYLSEESWRQYQPTLMKWQAEVDLYKMKINQAYTVGNMGLAHQYAMQLAQFEADTNTQLTQMQIDAASEAADKKTFWDVLGTGLGVLAAFAS